MDMDTLKTPLIIIMSMPHTALSLTARPLAVGTIFMLQIIQTVIGILTLAAVRTPVLTATATSGQETIISVQMS